MHMAQPIVLPVLRQIQETAQHGQFLVLLFHLLVVSDLFFRLDICEENARSKGDYADSRHESIGGNGSGHDGTGGNQPLKPPEQIVRGLQRAHRDFPVCQGHRRVQFLRIIIRHVRSLELIKKLPLQPADDPFSVDRFEGMLVIRLQREHRPQERHARQEDRPSPLPVFHKIYHCPQQIHIQKRFGNRGQRPNQQCKAQVRGIRPEHGGCHVKIVFNDRPYR